MFGRKKTNAEARGFARLGRDYELDERIALTGFSEVYSGRKRSTGQRVAIKVLSIRQQLPSDHSEQLKARFQREMEIYARLQHPNIVRLVDRGVLDDEDASMFLVLEYVNGEPLSEVLHREGALEVFEAKRIMSQCLDALSAAHQHGVVHRDFKPRNVLLTQTGTHRNAMVLDFGLAGITSDFETPARAGRQDRLTLATQVPGTVTYMAPEQIQGQVMPQSDIYAWGLVYIKVLTGELPLVGENSRKTLLRHLDEDPPIPKPLDSHPLGQLLARATVRDLEQRYSDASALLADLTACGVGGLSIPGARYETPRKPAKKGDKLKAHQDGVVRIPGEVKEAAMPPQSPLYVRYRELYESLGQACPVTHDQFLHSLSRHAARLKALHGCKNVDFDVGLEDSEVMILPTMSGMPQA